MGANPRPAENSTRAVDTICQRKRSRQSPLSTQNPMTPEKDVASAVIVPRSLQTHHHEARQQAPCAMPISADVGTVGKRVAQLAVAGTCGPLPRVIAGPQSTLSILHNCGTARPSPALGRCSSHRALETPQEALLVQKPRGPSSCFHVSDSCSPCLCTLQTPSKITSHLARERPPRFPASCNCVG